MEGPHNRIAGIDVGEGNFHCIILPLLYPVAALPYHDKLEGEVVE
jgi:hypothetical protein